MSQNLMPVCEEQELVGEAKTYKHCRSCFRKDLHVKVNWPPFLHGFLIVFSFGLILFARPSRCVCCGTVRYF